MVASVKKTKRIILAVTGASGTLFAVEFLKHMRTNGIEVHGLISPAGVQVMKLELDLGPADLAPYVERWYDVNDFTASMASGSSLFDGMVILPCTMGTLAAIAAGLSTNLIHRAADVTLKERRPLFLAVRETPLNRTHLTNMLKVHEAGGVICPPMPAFYKKPANLTEMAALFAYRLGDMLGVAMADNQRWQGLGDDSGE